MKNQAKNESAWKNYDQEVVANCEGLPLKKSSRLGAFLLSFFGYFRT